MEEVFQMCTQEDVEDNKNTDDTRNYNRAVSVGKKEDISLFRNFQWPMEI